MVINIQVSNRKRKRGQAPLLQATG